MYAYLKGIIEEIEEDNLVVEVNGIGYNVKMAAANMSILPPKGSTVKVYTYTSVREDAIWLYGFLTRDDLSMFKLLITVNGIGPKGAQAVLSAMPADELRFAIYAGDAKKIAKAPGIGAKTAQRIILDLKEKISLEDSLTHITDAETATANDVCYGNRKEAIEALTALGYSRSDAVKAVSAVVTDEQMDVEKILKLSLKQLAFL